MRVMVRENIRKMVVRMVRASVRAVRVRVRA